VDGNGTAVGFPVTVTGPGGPILNRAQAGHREVEVGTKFPVIVTATTSNTTMQVSTRTLALERVMWTAMDCC
jgi:hypothetical protein